MRLHDLQAGSAGAPDELSLQFSEVATLVCIRGFHEVRIAASFHDSQQADFDEVTPANRQTIYLLRRSQGVSKKILPAVRLHYAKHDGNV